MASGLPVIATNHSGAPEIVEEGVQGYVVPIRSSEVIRGHLRDLYARPEQRRQLGHAARERVLKHYPADRYARLVATTYSNLIQCRQPARHATTIS